MEYLPPLSGYIKGKRLMDGWALFYTGTSNEVFYGKRFASHQSAKAYYQQVLREQDAHMRRQIERVYAQGAPSHLVGDAHPTRVTKEHEK